MVAASSVGGATLQVLVIGIFIGSFGLWAVGLGAVAGRAASVTLLGPRVAPAFGRRLLSTSAVLLGVGAICILIGLSTNPTNESLPIRVLIAIGATAAMVSFVVRFVGSRNTVTARRAPS